MQQRETEQVENVKGRVRAMERRMLSLSSNNATVVTLNNAETMTTQKEKKITRKNQDLMKFE